LVHILLACGCPGTTPPQKTTQHCLQILADVNLSVQEHGAFFSAHGEDLPFSPRDISFITQQREQFIEQLQISVTQIEALIAHQQTLFKIFHDISVDPNTGLQIARTEVLPTAYRVPDAPTVRQPPGQGPTPPSRFQFYVVRRGHTTGVFQSWADAREQVHGFPNNEHRGFQDLNDAWAYVHEIPPAPFPSSSQ
jgi:hypothetical protein